MAILNYLNAGGTLDKIKQWGKITDLTNDGVKELTYSENGFFYVYGCRKGKFEIIWKREATQLGRTPYLDYVVDLNGDGIPELIVSNYERRYFHSIDILEWDGNVFTSLIEVKTTNYKGEVSAYDWLGGTILNYKIINTNKYGIKKIIAVDEVSIDPGDLSSGLPWRNLTIALEWNGEHFVITDKEYTSPQYRFQAVQDADNLVLKQNYDKALKLYQAAIFNDNLDWWSKDRKTYESKTTLDTWFQNAQKLMIETATPFPTLSPVTPDLTEYPKLAAYAYYRIMLLHIVQNHLSDAETVYKTLQQKFGNDQYGRPYVEMATAFWNAYQSTHKMYYSCASAIEYAAEHPEILVPLGSDYHGWQSKIYKPEDVCPFR